MLNELLITIFLILLYYCFWKHIFAAVEDRLSSKSEKDVVSENSENVDRRAIKSSNSKTDAQDSSVKTAREGSIKSSSIKLNSKSKTDNSKSEPNMSKSAGDNAPMTEKSLKTDHTKTDKSSIRSEIEKTSLKKTESKRAVDNAPMSEKSLKTDQTKTDKSSIRSEIEKVSSKKAEVIKPAPKPVPVSPSTIVKSFIKNSGPRLQPDDSTKGKKLSEWPGAQYPPPKPDN